MYGRVRSVLTAILLADRMMIFNAWPGSISGMKTTDGILRAATDIGTPRYPPVKKITCGLKSRIIAFDSCQPLNNCRKFFGRLGAASLLSGLFTREALSIGSVSASSQLEGKEIQHMVIFNLPYKKGSSKAVKFLNDGNRILTGIPVVRDFQVFLQVSAKNDFQYGFSY